MNDPSASASGLPPLSLEAISAQYERLLQRLEANEREFRRLGRAVWHVQEDERRRLARDLHPELQAFKDGERTDVTMKPFADMLSEQDMLDVAAYFAAQTPIPKGADPALVSLGQQIYRGGVPDRGVKLGGGVGAERPGVLGVDAQQLLAGGDVAVLERRRTVLLGDQVALDAGFLADHAARFGRGGVVG